jgi:hypothetical protein
VAAALFTLGHGALGVACLITAFLPERGRGVAARIVAWGGVGLGVALVVAHATSHAWRTVHLSPTSAAITGAATAGAWLLVAVMQLGSERWRLGCLVGVGAAGLTAFSTNEWLVPALLFWLCSSAAIAVLSAHATSRVMVWLALVVSDGLLVIVLANQVSATDNWRLLSPVSGWPFWVIVCSALIRLGTVPRLGVWGALGSPAAPALPLLVGGGFALIAGLAARAEPWLALMLVSAAVVVIAHALARARASLAAVAPWPVVLATGIAWLDPSSAGIAAVGALVPATALALWHESGTRARTGRALVFSFVPTTAGFAAVAAGAGASFDRAVGLPDLAEAVPWMGTAALLPVALAGSVVLGARIARGGWEVAAAELQSPVPDGGVAVLVVASITAGLSPTPLSFRWEDEVWLYLLALLGGMWAAAEAWRRNSGGPARALKDWAPGRPPGLGVPVVGPRTARLTAWAALGLGLAAGGAGAWITLDGLRTGFL